MPSHSESSPLLPLPLRTDTRVHYLDNLRTVLLVLLVLHHAAVTILATSTLDYNPIERNVLCIFTTTNKAFLWSTFYLVSGYSSALALSRGNGNLQKFVKRRSLPLAIHALVWGSAGRIGVSWALTAMQEKGGKGVFGAREVLEVMLVGPASYIGFLVLLDFVYVGLRVLGAPRLAHVLGGREGVLTAVVLTGIALLVCTYVNATQGSIAPLPSFLSTLISAFDYPLPDAPHSCIVAYTVGVNWAGIKDALPTTAISRFLFPFSLVASYAFLALASVLSTSISKYIQPDPARFPGARREFPYAGPNMHTFAFLLWDSLTSFILPFTLLWCFSSASLLRKSWAVRGTGTWKKGYVLTYVHMIPVLALRWFPERMGEEMGVKIRSAVVSAVVVGGLAPMPVWVVVRILEAIVVAVVNLRR
ncbi:hypothetical protein NLJ89_g11277 [Agrocybe chaxingu]|uniref:Heparan-alpha-glucosaminide N-acetyltransferase catalytic domain-containing protein n=1 Tax=Agrocybe chaxingu TaxID=84603 RepID=A0A9W8MPI0_9AGAR|nr:hypothetical protein NLJ89_g11277 [Agrocybe chaxingu]